MASILETRSMLAERYSLEREIGRGGMATVYLARDLRNQNNVALKVLNPNLASLVTGERFQREIAITGGLQHPRIVPLLDSGAVDGLPFYTMPFVDGETLGARLERERQLGIREAIQIAIDVADALGYAHGKGVIHRDIKPDNILLSGGRAIVSDFGVARALDLAAEERLTSTGIAIGTPVYMSPEQSAGGPVDARSDVYALGCVLYEMLAGSAPFSGGLPQTVLARHALDPVPPLSTARPTVGPDLQRIVMRALQKAPADRFGSAAEMQQSLELVLFDDSAPEYPVTRRGRKRWRVAAASAVTAVGVGSALAYYLTGPNLEANRVAIFPPAAVTGNAAMADDIATMIRHQLDASGTLATVDGISLVSRDRVSSPRELRATSRAHRARFYVSGRVTAPHPESIAVFLQLVDAGRDSLIRSSNAVGAVRESWRVASRALTAILPALVPGQSADELSGGWMDRSPAAVVSFLHGEAAYRHNQSDSALTHYRAALAGDSTFALAALRGAQAATEIHRYEEGLALARVAASSPLPGYLQHYARAYVAYLEGKGDSAVAELRRALAIRRDVASVWEVLGEVHTHLLWSTGGAVLRADSAFAEARRLDPTLVRLLTHPIEVELRLGRVSNAESMIRRVAASQPDSSYLRRNRIMRDCAAKGPGAVEWAREVASHPLTVLSVGALLSVGGGKLDCSLAAFRAIRQFETPAMAAANPNVDARRWTATEAIVRTLIAQGHAAAALTLVDSAIAGNEGGRSLLLMHGELSPHWRAAAESAATYYEEQWGRDCLRCTSNDRLWQLGVWRTFKGDSVSVDAIARELAKRAKAAKDPRLQFMAEATAARGLLAQADTSRAIEALYAILRYPIPPGGLLQWAAPEGRGPERLALGRVLLARKKHKEAMAVLDGFNDGWNPSLLPYLPASLELRIQAAETAGDMALLAAYRAQRARIVGR